MELHPLRLQHGIPVLRYGEHRAACPGHHPSGVRIVRVDDRVVAAGEQLRLGIAVGIHGFVEIQMVLRQIGKGRHRVVDTADTVQGDGVAGNLHHHILASGSVHLRKQLLQFQTVRGGALGGDGPGADEISHGAHQPHLGPQHGFQHILQQQGDGGFSVGAGDADDLHFVGGAAVEVAGNPGKGLPVGGHQHIGHILPGFLGRHHHPGPLFHCHGNKPVAVGGKTGNCHKQAARLRFPGIVANGSNVLFRIGCTRQNRDIFQQFFQ